MSNDGQDKQERPERQPDRQPEHVKRAQGEINANVSDYTEHVTARRLEKKLSGNSGATGQLPDQNGKGIASAKDLLGDNAHGLSKKEKQAALLAQVEKDGYIVGKPKDEKQEAAKAERLEQVEKNYHRDIARQIKDAIKGTPHLDKNEAQPEAKHPSEKPKEIKLAVPSYQIAHPEAAPIDLSPAVQQAKKDVTQSVRQDINAFWKPTEGTVIKANDLMQGHSSDSQKWKDVDIAASKQAFDAFPKLAQYQLPKETIAGLILNEVRHRDPKDMMEDVSVRLFGNVRTITGKEDPQASIGPGQLQIQTIKDLATKYPQLQKFEDPVKSALEPDKAPFFVAAYLNERITTLEAHNKTHPDSKVDIGLKSLLFSYNPDVLVRDGIEKPTANDYRAITPAEKVENSITHKKPDTEQGWHSVMYATNDLITEKSEVVKDMMAGIEAIRRHEESALKPQK